MVVIYTLEQTVRRINEKHISNYIAWVDGFGRRAYILHKSP